MYNMCNACHMEHYIYAMYVTCKLHVCNACHYM